MGNNFTGQNTQIHQILTHWSLPSLDHNTFRAEQVHGFSGAPIFRVKVAQEHYALRGWEQDSLPLPRILGLHRLLNSLKNDGVQTVAPPLVAASGSTLVELFDRQWQLEPWLPGEPDFGAPPAQERIRASMTALFDWHRAARHFTPSLSEQHWFDSRTDYSPAVRERLKKLLSWNSHLINKLHRKVNADPWPDFQQVALQILPLFILLQKKLEGELRSMVPLKFSLQPCLRDVWREHVLFTKNRVTGLIDPSACRSENVVTDLSRLLGSFCGDDQTAWAIALDHYQSMYSLTSFELGLLRVLDRSQVLLSGMTWLQRRYFTAHPFAQPEKVCLRLARILKRLQRLGDEI